MNEVIITVRGSHEVRKTAELATITITARSDGANRGDVIARTSLQAETVREALEATPPQEWSASGLATRSERPWNHEGKQLDLVHHATVTFTATFTSAESLAHVSSVLAETENIEITAVVWDLEAATRSAIEREVATVAVKDAVTRAEAYAAALGLTSITATEVADVGLLAPGAPTAAPPMAMRAMSAESSDLARITEASEIAIRVDVEARFRAQ